MKAHHRLMDFLRSRLTKDQRRFVKFIAVGASGVPVNLGVVFAVTAALSGACDHHVRDAVSYLAGIAASIFTNFLLNNLWTWGDRAAEDPGGFLRRLAKFYLVSSIAATIQFFTTILLSSWMRWSVAFSRPIHGEYRLYHALAPLAGIAVGTVINFTANHLWTFRSRKGT